METTSANERSDKGYSLVAKKSKVVSSAAVRSKLVPVAVHVYTFMEFGCWKKHRGDGG